MKTYRTCCLTFVLIFGMITKDSFWALRIGGPRIFTFFWRIPPARVSRRQPSKVVRNMGLTQSFFVCLFVLSYLAAIYCNEEREFCEATTCAEEKRSGGVNLANESLFEH